MLLIAGRTRAERVGSDKRTKKYVVDDYILLENTINRFEQRYTTPHIVTESSNLLGAGTKTMIPGAAAMLAADVVVMKEIYLPSAECVATQTFMKFGVTDTAIYLIAARERVVVLTDDFPLYSLLSRMNLPAMNFNHARGYR
jgi:rRNA maturation endonuclease Nob1